MNKDTNGNRLGTSLSVGTVQVLLVNLLPSLKMDAKALHAVCLFVIHQHLQANCSTEF